MSSLRVVVDDVTTPLPFAGYLLAVLVNSKGQEGSKVIVELKAAGSVNGGIALMDANGQVKAEGSMNVVKALLQEFSTVLFKDEEERKETEQWLKVAEEELVGNDFQKLSGAFVKLNEHLKLRTFFVLGVELSAADLLLWSQLKNSNVWAKLVKTPGSAAGEEATRWFNYLSTSVPLVVDSVNELTEQGKALKEKKKDQASFEIGLEGAEDGKVVTRFPPEPSGYLHIGHAKAAILNQYFANKYNGKLLIRFDDTNPSKEKDEYEQSILEDLELLGVKGSDSVTHTSDYFDLCEKYCEQMIREGKAYADDTELEQMRDERLKCVDSKCRGNSVEENLRRWDEMRKGSEAGLLNCIRAKINMQDNNGALRDPVIYRCNLLPHHRTGSKYKVYPTYDFACPIVDSVEGVTHALRTNEYADRNDQYYWMINAMGLRRPCIWDYSRLNFVYTLLSKRKLNWFVNEGKVTGWDDPRFPTVRGIRRRGLTIEALREYILMQGPSKNTVLLEWDKLWTVNKKVIDPIAPRYTALNRDNLCKVVLTGEGVPTEALLKEMLLHKKNPAVGTKMTAYSSSIFIEQADALVLELGEEFTLMDWGNAIVKSIEPAGPDHIASITAELNLSGDFKKTKKKLTWLSPDPQPLLPLSLHDYDYLINKKKLEENDKFEDCLTPVTEFVTAAVGDANMASLKKGDIIQLERKGFFIVDEALNGDKPMKLIAIPDGKSKSIAAKTTDN